MDCDCINRRLLITGLLACVTAGPGLAQHTDQVEGGHASGGGGSGRGGQGGGQHGRPADRHTGEDDHTDDHTDDHADDHDDDHGDDHASGGKGRGGPKYRGGKTTAVSGFGRGRSLEDRVLKLPAF